MRSYRLRKPTTTSRASSLIDKGSLLRAHDRFGTTDPMQRGGPLHRGWNMARAAKGGRGSGLNKRAQYASTWSTTSRQLASPGSRRYCNCRMPPVGSVSASPSR